MADVSNINLQQLLQMSSNQQLMNNTSNSKPIINKTIFNEVVGQTKKPMAEVIEEQIDDHSVVSSSGNMPAFFLNDPMSIDESKEHILQKQFMRKGFGTTFRKPKPKPATETKKRTAKEEAEEFNDAKRNTACLETTKTSLTEDSLRSVSSSQPSVGTTSAGFQIKNSSPEEEQNTWAIKKKKITSKIASPPNQPDSTVLSPTSNSNDSMSSHPPKATSTQMHMLLDQQKRKIQAVRQKKIINMKNKTAERNQSVFLKHVLSNQDSLSKSLAGEGQFNKSADQDEANDADVDEEINPNDQSQVEQEVEMERKISKEETNGSLENQEIDSTTCGEVKSLSSNENSSISSLAKDPGKPPIIRQSPTHPPRSNRLPKSSESTSHTRTKLVDQGEQTSPPNESFMDKDCTNTEYDDISEISSISQRNRRNMPQRSMSQKPSRKFDYNQANYTDQEDSYCENPPRMPFHQMTRHGSIAPLNFRKIPRNNSIRTDVEDFDGYTHQDYLSDNDCRSGVYGRQRAAYHYTQPHYPALPFQQQPNYDYSDVEGQIQYHPPYIQHPPRQMIPPYPHQYYQQPQMFNPNPQLSNYEPQFARNMIDPRGFRNPEDLMVHSSFDLNQTNVQLDELSRKLAAFQDDIFRVASQQQQLLAMSDRQENVYSSNSTLNNITHRERARWDRPKKDIPIKKEVSRTRNSNVRKSHSQIYHNEEINGFSRPNKESSLRESSDRKLKRLQLDLQGPHSCSSPGFDRDQGEENQITYPILAEDDQQHRPTMHEELFELKKSFQKSNRTPLRSPRNVFDQDADLDDEKENDTFESNQMFDFPKPESLTIEYNKPNQELYLKKMKEMEMRKKKSKEEIQKFQEERKAQETNERLEQEKAREEKKQREAEKRKAIYQAYLSRKEAERDASENSSSTKNEVNIRRMNSTTSVKSEPKKRPALPIPNASSKEPIQSHLMVKHLSPKLSPSRTRNNIDPEAKQRPVVRNQSSRDANVPGWASKHASEIDLTAFDGTNKLNSLKRNTQRSTSNLAKSHAGSLSIINSPANNLSASQNLKLFAKPKVKTNRNLIANAIKFVCLAGNVNRENQEATLKKMNEAEGQHFIILFRDSRCQYRGLYSFDPNTEECVNIAGVGPARITHEMVEFFFKYNSGGKDFTMIKTTNHISTVIDAIVIQNNYWMSRPQTTTTKS